ncbi:MAG: hypothetical protein ACP5NI_04020, partial [Acetobacteraceae bacterium]
MVRNVVTVGAWTMASRVLGFLRDILIARFLGAGMAADAFFVALRLPGLLRPDVVGRLGPAERRHPGGDRAAPAPDPELPKSRLPPTSR